MKSVSSAIFKSGGVSLNVSANVVSAVDSCVVSKALMVEVISRLSAGGEGGVLRNKTGDRFMFGDIPENFKPQTAKDEEEGFRYVLGDTEFHVFASAGAGV